MPKALTQAQIDACFAVIERAAIAGERCPQSYVENSVIHRSALLRLIRQDRISIAISGRNYRTVTLLTGPHAGKSTKPDPSGAVIWKVVDKRGTHRPAPIVRARPSAPRPLQPHELA
jgi:hypothetical protein